MERCESKLALLDYEELNFDDYSSGYESTTDSSDSETTNFQSVKETGSLDFKSVNYQNKALNFDFNFVSKRPFTDKHENVKIQQKLVYKNTQALTDHLRIVSSLPELCDVTFEVGPGKVKVHGVKAILGTRSRVLYNLILKKQREEEFQSKSNRKTDNSNKKTHKKKGIQINKVIINVKKYQPEDFRKIVDYIHCGSVDIDSYCVAGLLCGASQFELYDLEEVCWDFVKHCIRNGTAGSLLPSAKKYRNFTVGQQLLEKILCSVTRYVDL